MNKIDSQNELTLIPSETHLDEISNWEGKDVSSNPVDGETTKKSKNIFSKMKNFMKSCWKHKYKILLATLGVITLGATSAGLATLIAKKVNSKALPKIKGQEEKDESNEVKDSTEETQVETQSPKLVHLNRDRPLRHGIRPPNRHNYSQQLATKQEDVAVKDEENEKQTDTDNVQNTKVEIEENNERETTNVNEGDTNNAPEKLVEDKQIHDQKMDEHDTVKLTDDNDCVFITDDNEIILEDDKQTDDEQLIDEKDIEEFIAKLNLEENNDVLNDSTIDDSIIAHMMNSFEQEGQNDSVDDATIDDSIIADIMNNMEQQENQIASKPKEPIVQSPKTRKELHKERLSRRKSPRSRKNVEAGSPNRRARSGKKASKLLKKVM